MSKYIIVSKSPEGNQYGKSYTITYQLCDDTTMYKIDLYCYNKIKNRYDYCYIDGHTGYGVETEEDKNEFLMEFYKFQKGGSYRKTHPVQYSEEDQIKFKIKEKENEIYELKNELETAEYNRKQQKFVGYYDNVDRQGLNNYISSLRSVAFDNNRYCIHNAEYHIWEGHRLYVYDKQLNKDVLVLVYDKDKGFITRDLTPDDM